MLYDEHRIITEKTIEGIENLERDVKETVKAIVFDQWDPENLQIIEQLKQLVNRSEELKQEIIKKDIAIFELRERVAEKRKYVKQSKQELEILKSHIEKTEESLVKPM